ncbi:hypothetical protein Hrd1104_10540 [Halorhabdus sp. CBA1104]|uniref:hypothetical protein n=1 Tax=Halorhabdus sp. CBA1104 TaxID=1380432 RepID=UPI0012B3AF00|nr:hypothetical protein [Halorhabdus sp. CBA1104]QGN07692.1 hypothetical protein Hrd1104_10540 [Halorhabdus sp. CBA1104]
MTDSETLKDKHERNRERRYEQIKRWAAYVRTHPDEDWGRQVNTLVDAQLESARHASTARVDREDANGRE